MAYNNYTPLSFSPNSMNGSYTDNSSFMVGDKRGYMVSNTMTTNNSSNRLVDPPQEPSEDIIPPSSKRPRGRPLGSKNKPKPPPSPLMKLVTFEIPAGMDIVGILIDHAQKHNVGIAVLSGFGLISSVTLIEPVSLKPTFPIVGPFYMTSMTGTYVNPKCHSVSPRFIPDPIYSCFSICLASNDENVYAGIVGGQVVTADVVTVVTALFRTREIYREVSAGGVINNVGLVAPQPNNNGNNNNNNIFTDVPNFNVVGVNSTEPNHQMPPPPHHLPNVPNFNVVGVNSTEPNHQMPPPHHHLPNGDDDVIQWIYSTRTNNY